VSQSSEDCGCATPCPTGACPDTNPPDPEPTTCTPYEYQCGDWLVKVDANGCTTRERVANNVLDGTYANATVTIVDGCIAGISSGTNILQQRPEPCISAGTGTPPTPTTVGLDPSACNLLSGPASALLARGHFSPGSNITVTGCGSQSNPWVVSYTGALPGAEYVPTFKYGVAVQTPLVTPVVEVASTTLAVGYSAGVATVNTEGADFSGSGITISKGLVKAFTLPVMTVTPGGGVTASTTNGVVTLGFDLTQVSFPTKSVVGASCGGAFIDPATGAAPAGGTMDTAQFVKYGSRVYTGVPYNVTAYSSLGLAIGSGTGFIATPSAAAAQALLDSVYTFSGTGAC